MRTWSTRLETNVKMEIRIKWEIAYCHSQTTLVEWSPQRAIKLGRATTQSTCLKSRNYWKTNLKPTTQLSYPAQKRQIITAPLSKNMMIIKHKEEIINLITASALISYWPPMETPFLLSRVSSKVYNKNNLIYQTWLRVTPINQKILLEDRMHFI